MYPTYYKCITKDKKTTKTEANKGMTSDNILVSCWPWLILKNKSNLDLICPWRGHHQEDPGLFARLESWKKISWKKSAYSKPILLPWKEHEYVAKIKSNNSILESTRNLLQLVP